MATALCLAIQNCGRCKQFEAKSQLPGMEPILCTQPMELVHIDYVGMEVTVAAKEKPVVKNVLVVMDHFTRYVQAFVTKNHTARTTARVLYNNFFSVFGFPQKLLSDQGTEFTWRRDRRYVQVTRNRENQDYTVPPANQRIGRESTPDPAEDDRQARPGKTPEMARAHWIRIDRLQCYSVTGDRVLPVLFNVRAEAQVACRPTIPDSETTENGPVLSMNM